MKIELLCTGDEILSGKTVNTNYSYMAQRLVENGFEVYWGTTVGDDKESLEAAFFQAGQRADVVIVNGGLGPTVDDLSQQVAADAAGVELELHEDWLARMDAWYTARGRVMPENNIKQAMLPVGAEFVDNPIGTACGFAVDIGKGRFYFTPGVPREMRRMIDEQIIPRLQKKRGYQVVTRVKRFHTFGIGESRADKLLEGVEDIAANNAVKLGFQSHYPQLETKLTIQGSDLSQIDGILGPVEAEVRNRLGDFVLSEDDDSVEGIIVELLSENNATVAIMEMSTGGNAMSRLLGFQGGDEVIKRGITSLDLAELGAAAGLEIGITDQVTLDTSARLAEMLRVTCNANYGFVILTSDCHNEQSDESGVEFYIAIATDTITHTRDGQLPGGPEWVRLGATELGLDCLRRCLSGLPIYQRIDFEQH